jgi:hypothetical protein
MLPQLRWPPRDFFAFLARLRERDSDGLFAAFYLSALAAFATSCGAALVTAHFSLDIPTRARGVFAFTFPLLRHAISPQIMEPP